MSARRSTRSARSPFSKNSRLNSTTVRAASQGSTWSVIPTTPPARSGSVPIAYGEPEHVIDFVLRCAEAFDLSGRWGFTWALTCSKPRLDGFGGGAQLIDLGERRSIAWLDCEHWLAGSLDTATDPKSTVVNSTADGGEPVMGTSMDAVQNASVVVIAPPAAAP